MIILITYLIIVLLCLISMYIITYLYGDNLANNLEFLNLSDIYDGDLDFTNILLLCSIPIFNIIFVTTMLYIARCGEEDLDKFMR